MSTFLQIILILLLFVVLTKSAGIIIERLQKIGKKFHIKEAFLGIFLGVLTTLPEGMIAINAAINNIPKLALGNLFGGIIVLFSLVLGFSVMLNHGIRTSGNSRGLLKNLLFILLPLFLGLRGELAHIDGLLILGWYGFIMYQLYGKSKKRREDEKEKEKPEEVTFEKSQLSSDLLMMAIGIVAMVLSSNFIVDLTENILVHYQVKPFTIGLLLFSVGTNLPELLVAVTAWKKKLRQLSLNNLFGSAFANIMIIGFMATLIKIPMTINISYYVTFVFLIILFAVLARFYRSGRRLTRREGMYLLGFYAFFVIIELVSQLIL